MNSDKYKKQTRVVYRDNQHIRIVHPYVCLLSTTLAVLVNRSIIVVSHNVTSLKKQAFRDVLYVCVDYLYMLLLFVCFLALLSLLHFSILSNCFLYLYV